MPAPPGPISFSKVGPRSPSTFRGHPGWLRPDREIQSASTVAALGTAPLEGSWVADGGGGSTEAGAEPAASSSGATPPRAARPRPLAEAALCRARDALVEGPPRCSSCFRWLAGWPASHRRANAALSDGPTDALQGALPLSGAPSPGWVLPLGSGLIPDPGLQRRLRLLLPEQHCQGEPGVSAGAGAQGRGGLCWEPRQPAKLELTPQARLARAVLEARMLLLPSCCPFPGIWCTPFERGRERGPALVRLPVGPARILGQQPGPRWPRCNGTALSPFASLAML